MKDSTDPTGGADELAELLLLARSAPPNDRIDLYRNRIADCGLAGIEAMDGWLEDPDLWRFAVRTLGRAATGELKGEAVATLKQARIGAPSSVRDDISAELKRLGVQVKPVRESPPRRHPYDVAPLPANAGLSWRGFRANEFGNVVGTTWRRGKDPGSLPPIILRGLRDVHPHFDSWAIYRWPAVHFAITDRYRQFEAPESGWRAAKMVVYAHGPTDEDPALPRRVVAGLYVEKGDGSEKYGPVDARWDWPRFVSSLVEPAINERLTDVMVRHDLTLGDLTGRKGDVENFIGGAGRIENGILVFRSHDGAELLRGWEALRHYLESLSPEGWHNVHIWRQWSDKEAVDAGSAFAREALVPVLVDLGTLYLEIVKDAVVEGIQALHRVEARRVHPDGRPEVVFIGQAHAAAGHFSIPRAVMDELEIPTDGRVWLTVETLEGQRRYSGELDIRSGQEIYFRVSDLETRGLDQVRPHEWLRVTVSRS